MAPASTNVRWLSSHIVRPSVGLFCCVSLAALAYVGVNYPSSTSEATLPLAKADRGLHLVPIPSLVLQHPPISEFHEISERPLFTPVRRPKAAAATTQAQVYRLRGVLISNSQKIALVQRIDDGTLLRVSEGDLVDVWRVSAIDRDSITWSRQDRLREMVVSEIWEDGGALSSPDALQPDLSGENGLNEQTNASSHLNTPRRHHGGERALPHRRLTPTADYVPFVMPTEPLPPTPTAPRRPPIRRI